MALPFADKRVRACVNPDVRVALRVAEGFTPSQVNHAQRVRTRAIFHLQRVLATADFVATPTCPCAAPEMHPSVAAGGSETNLPLVLQLMRFMPLANFTGHPAVTVPVGLCERSGMPAGLQLVGRYWHEASLLHAAAVVEAALQPQRQPPAVFYDVLHAAVVAKAAGTAQGCGAAVLADGATGRGLREWD